MNTYNTDVSFFSGGNSEKEWGITGLLPGCISISPNNYKSSLRRSYKKSDSNKAQILMGIGPGL